MSKKKSKAQKATPKASPKPKAEPLKKSPKAPVSKSSASLTAEEIEAANFPFSKQNYLFMLIGLALIAAGFLIMALDGEPYGFGFLGLTLGPIITFTGFMFEIFAILYNGDK